MTEIEVFNDGVSRTVEVWDDGVLLHTFTQAVDSEPAALTLEDQVAALTEALDLLILDTLGGTNV